VMILLLDAQNHILRNESIHSVMNHI